MARQDPLWQIRSFVRKSGAPLGLFFVAITVVGFLAVWFMSGSAGPGGLLGLMFLAGSWLARPWTLFTYWLIAPLAPLCLLGVLMGLYFFGLPLERRWGTQRFASYSAIILLATPLAFWLGFLFTGVGVGIASLADFSAACVVSYATLYPTSEIRLWAVIPVQAKWIGWGTAILFVLDYGYGSPVLVIFAAVPMVLAWAFPAGRLALPTFQSRPRPVRGSREDDYRGFDLDKRMETEAERRRLKELFERSFKEDEDGEKPG